MVDECRVCGGMGIPEGACDCAGNVLDECGVCGGDGLAGRAIATATFWMHQRCSELRSTACEDDGSCVIFGCTSPSAVNFNIEATDDDGSCQGAPTPFAISIGKRGRRFHQHGWILHRLHGRERMQLRAQCHHRQWPCVHQCGVCGGKAFCQVHATAQATSLTNAACEGKASLKEMRLRWECAGPM